MIVKKKLYYFLILFFLFCGIGIISYSYNSYFIPFGRIKNITSKPVEYILAISFGTRRIWADISFIRLMQYYGTPEIPENAKVIEHRDSHGHIHYHYEGEPEFGAGKYPLFERMAKDIIFLDPYYKEAIIYSAGSLAFNLNRPEQAISLLNLGLIFSPKEWQYIKMLAAIAQSKLQDKQKIASFMYEIAMFDDTPVMVKQIAAFLNKRAGKIENALKIYKKILLTTKDEFYIKNAIRNIELIEKRKYEDTENYK